MQSIRGVFFLAVCLALSACESPLGESWNNAVARLQPDREEERAARYGLRENPQGNRRRSVDSDTVYLGPKATPTPAISRRQDAGEVQLKPFRSTQTRTEGPAQNRMKVESKPSPTPSEKKPRPTPKPTPKSSPKPTPEKVAAQEGPIEETPKPAAEKSDGPPPFASPVPGRKGYVTSPFSPTAGFIDVNGLEPGSEAKDPYSGKVFRVP